MGGSGQEDPPPRWFLLPTRNVAADCCQEALSSPVFTGGKIEAQRD